MKHTEWAQAQGNHMTTAYRWYREENLPVPARKIGLDRQVAGLLMWTAQAGMPVVRVEAEVGPGVTG